jgi:hypothetical protein
MERHLERKDQLRDPARVWQYSNARDVMEVVVGLVLNVMR